MSPRSGASTLSAVAPDHGVPEKAAFPVFKEDAKEVSSRNCCSGAAWWVIAFGCKAPTGLLAATEQILVSSIGHARYRLETVICSERKAQKTNVPSDCQAQFCNATDSILPERSSRIRIVSRGRQRRCLRGRLNRHLSRRGNQCFVGSTAQSCCNDRRAKKHETADHDAYSIADSEAAGHQHQPDKRDRQDAQADRHRAQQRTGEPIRSGAEHGGWRRSEQGSGYRQRFRPASLGMATQWLIAVRPA